MKTNYYQFNSISAIASLVNAEQYFNFITGEEDMKGYYFHKTPGFTGRAGIEFYNGRSKSEQDDDFTIRHKQMLENGCMFVSNDELRKSGMLENIENENKYLKENADQIFEDLLTKGEEKYGK